MEALLLGNASLTVTAGALLAYLVTIGWERLRPLLPPDDDGPARWAGNFGLLLVNHAVPFLVLPAITAFAAWWAAAPGLLPAFDLPLWVGVLLALAALDLKGWLLHWALHRVPALWRVHQVHHSDLRFDATLAFRFHPGEAALVALTSSLVVIVLGLPAEAVLASGLLGALHNVFVHANASLGGHVEAAVRRVFVTPDLHRVHHSAVVEDSMRNFGIVFSFWDRLFGTWRTPVGSGPRMFGLEAERDPLRLSLPRLLLMPLRRST